jgi:hypothetical protein
MSHLHIYYRAGRQCKKGHDGAASVPARPPVGWAPLAGSVSCASAHASPPPLSGAAASHLPGIVRWAAPRCRRDALGTRHRCLPDAPDPCRTARIVPLDTYSRARLTRKYYMRFALPYRPVQLGIDRKTCEIVYLFAGVDQLRLDVLVLRRNALEHAGAQRRECEWELDGAGQR